MSTSIDPQEIEHFSKDAAHWWDENGPFKPLHRLNPVRLRYIRDQIGQHYGLDDQSLKPFKGLSFLDIGCGGGLVCEPLARLGGTVTGIDADPNAIDVANNHAEQSGLVINYQNMTAEQLLQPSPPRRRGSGKPAKSKPLETCPDARLRGHDDCEQFDVVLALEIIEHVSDVDNFVQNCVDLCKPGGLVILSTLNRTPQSFALGIVAAEYIMRWVPRGTHQWKKFVRPSELSSMARQAGGKVKNIKGLFFNPVKSDFELSDRNMSVNYFMVVEK